eukprot:1179519-Prorocentrum_minimum.AAC.2
MFIIRWGSAPLRAGGDGDANDGGENRILQWGLTRAQRPVVAPRRWGSAPLRAGGDGDAKFSEKSNSPVVAWLNKGSTRCGGSFAGGEAQRPPGGDGDAAGRGAARHEVPVGRFPGCAPQRRAAHPRGGQEDPRGERWSE